MNIKKTKTAMLVVFSLLGINQTVQADDSIDDLLNSSVIKVDKPADNSEKQSSEQSTLNKNSAKPVLPDSVANDKYQGMIVNRNGNEQIPESNLNVLKYNPLAESRPDFAKRLYSLNKDVIINVLNKSTAFAVGPVQGDDKTVYVFFDPQCPHCSNLWKESQNEKLKDIQFIWIPVGYMNDSSQPQGATILMNSDPVGTMNKHETLFEKDQRGITPSATISKNIIDRIKINTLIFANLNINGEEKKDDFQVPLMLHMTKSGQISFVEGEVSSDKIQTFINE